MVFARALSRFVLLVCCCCKGVLASTVPADTQFGPSLLLKWIFSSPKASLAPAEQTDLLVVGAGFGRTGTASLVQALGMLGLKSYHMKDGVMAVPGHLDLWRRHAEEKLKGGVGHGDEILNGMAANGFNATLSLPAAALYKDMLRRYPKARVILTVRSDGNGHAWAKSVQGSVLRLAKYMSRAPFRWLPIAKSMPTMMQWSMGVGVGAPTEIDMYESSEDEVRDYLAANYHRWIDEVRAHVPARQLLVFPAKDGWKPLCEFLSPVHMNVAAACRDILASGEPYPYVNERSQFEAAVRIVRLVSAVFDFGPFLFLAGFVLWRKYGGRAAAGGKPKTS